MAIDLKFVLMANALTVKTTPAVPVATAVSTKANSPVLHTSLDFLKWGKGSISAIVKTPINGASMDAFPSYSDLIQTPRTKDPAPIAISAHLDALNRTAVAQDLVNRAGKTGLSAAETQRLADILNESEDFAADSRLVADLLDTNNPNRGLRTFCELDSLRRQHPERITPEIVRTLSMGVGESRTGGVGEDYEGILGCDAAYRAAETLVVMNKADYNRIMFAFSEAGVNNNTGSPQTERALILKAVAAREYRLLEKGLPALTLGSADRATSEIVGFAKAIHGQPRAELIRRTSLMDLDADDDFEALQQKWGNSCTPAAIEILRGEADPIYAWELQGKDAIHGPGLTGAVADEQRAMLEANGVGAMTDIELRIRRTQAEILSAITGKDAAYHVPGLSPENPLNGLVSALTGRIYELFEVGNTNAARGMAADRIEALVQRGVDVPITVRWPDGNTHTMLITDASGYGAGRFFVVTDPGFGRTYQIGRDRIVNNAEPYFGQLVEYFT